MFGKQALGCPLHLCLRHCVLECRMIWSLSCALLSEKRINKCITFRWRRSNACWGIDIWCRYNGQSMARRALSLLGCLLSAGYFVFSASSDISKDWCVIADKRIICWWRIFDRLPTSANCWGWSTISLLKVFVRIQRSIMRWKCNQRYFCMYLVISALIVFIQGNAVNLQWPAEEVFLPFWPPLCERYGGKWCYLPIG